MFTKHYVLILCSSIFYLYSSNLLYGNVASSNKLIICGVCKDIEAFVPNMMRNIEELGSQFQDYRVIIYENNSQDQTARLLLEWAASNEKITFLSETLPDSALAISHTEKIARARNIVLDEVKKINFQDYRYLIMADLDFLTTWPIAEIVASLDSPIEWDCVTANSIKRSRNKVCSANDCKMLPYVYWDRYAYRSVDHPFGPELLGDRWWGNLSISWFWLTGDDWIPVYSAFGGLAIYKTATIINFTYSGVVTEDLTNYYKAIISEIPLSHSMLSQLGLTARSNAHLAPIKFQYNTLSNSPSNYPFITCCEHVTLHASMALYGFKKIYINPKIIIRY